jgi:hypothetical protein
LDVCFRAGLFHTRAGLFHTRAGFFHTRAGLLHTMAGLFHTLAGLFHYRATLFHTWAGLFHTRAGLFHTCRCPECRLQSPLDARMPLSLPPLTSPPAGGRGRGGSANWHPVHVSATHCPIGDQRLIPEPAASIGVNKLITLNFILFLLFFT